MSDRDQALRDAMADAVLTFDKWEHTGADRDRKAWLAEVEHVADVLGRMIVAAMLSDGDSDDGDS